MKTNIGITSWFKVEPGIAGNQRVKRNWYSKRQKRNLCNTMVIMCLMLLEACSHHLFWARR